MASGAVAPETDGYPYYAVALYSYDGTSPSELSFKKDDVLDVIRACARGWILARLTSTGAQGHVPEGYVSRINKNNWDPNQPPKQSPQPGSVAKVSSALESEPLTLAEAVHSFESHSPIELSIQKGDKVQIMSRPPCAQQGGWVFVKKDSSTGYVPHAYLKILPQEYPYEARVLYNHAGTGNELTITVGDLLTIEREARNGWLYATNRQSASGYIPAKYVEKLSQQPLQVVTPFKGRMLYAHHGVGAELTLAEGDLVNVLKSAARGWLFVGSGSKFGYVPQAYVQRLPDDSDNTNISVHTTAFTCDPPNEYMCPITLEIMTEPVVAPDGFLYEKSAISSWLQKQNSSPITGAPFHLNPVLTPCVPIKSAISAWVAAHRKKE
ncbi:sorbin and SH3 domain containing 1 [Pelomyxa schiedti]|nr:sorbin and SH3 domain containing 1 [Pelomyxa schiedti]